MLLYLTNIINNSLHSMEILIALKFFFQFDYYQISLIPFTIIWVLRFRLKLHKLFLVKILLASKLIDAKFFRTNEVTQQIYAVISVVKLSPWMQNVSRVCEVELFSKKILLTPPSQKPKKVKSTQSDHLLKTPVLYRNFRLKENESFLELHGVNHKN